MIFKNNFLVFVLLCFGILKLE